MDIKKIFSSLFLLTVLPTFAGCNGDISSDQAAQSASPVSPEVESTPTISQNYKNEKFRGHHNHGHNRMQNNTVENNDTENTISSVSGELEVIPDRCIACGKCYHIDSEHFIRTNGGKALVVSQENLDSSLLNRAIRSCPTNAIQL